MNPLPNALRAIVSFSALAAASTAFASAPLGCEATSPEHRVAVVELFTSEGCSSCPPADRWLSSLARSGYGPERVLALSLHVGYWDYIGWADPYAHPKFTDRQRAYAHARGSTTIYTPQVVLDGRDYRDWRGQSAFARDVAAINAQRAPVRLKLKATQQSGSVSIDVEAQQAGAPSQPAVSGKLQIAVFEDGLSNRVSRGENRGATLGHDRVVRHWLEPVAFDGARNTVSRRVDLGSDVVASRAGIAAFVQKPDGSMLQAVACQLR